MDETRENVPRKRATAASRIYRSVYLTAMAIGLLVLTLKVVAPAAVVVIFAAAFAVFCVWLTVRIVNRRERWAKWTLGLVLVSVVLYPLSAGPVIWLGQRGCLPEWAGWPLSYLYLPLGYLQSIPALSRLLDWYMGLWY